VNAPVIIVDAMKWQVDWANGWEYVVPAVGSNVEHYMVVNNVRASFWGSLLGFEITHENNYTSRFMTAAMFRIACVVLQEGPVK